MNNILQLVLNKCTSGLYLVSSHFGDKINGQISDALMQVESKPQRIILSISKKELTHEFIAKSKVFGVSVLKKNCDLNLIKTFGFNSGRNIDKFSHVPFALGKNGSPLLTKEVVATFEGEVFLDVDVGGHTVFFAEVKEGALIEESDVLTYCDYRDRIKAKLHENSPSFYKTDKKS